MPRRTTKREAGSAPTGVLRPPRLGARNRRSTIGGLSGIVAALTLGVALSACGSSGATTATNSTAKAPTTTSASGATAVADTSKACSTWLEVDAAEALLGSSGGQPGPTQFKTFAHAVKPILGDFVAVAPAQPRAQAAAVLAKVSKAIETNNYTLIDVAGNQQLAGKLSGVEQWVRDSCGFGKLTVDAVDFEFDNLPAKLNAGPVSIKFVNTSKDAMHQLMLLQIQPGAPVTADQLAAGLKAGTKPPSSGPAAHAVKPISETFALPGMTTYTTANLTPGSYVAVCFVADHAEKGMVQTLTVS